MSESCSSELLNRGGEEQIDHVIADLFILFEVNLLENILNQGRLDEERVKEQSFYRDYGWSLYVFVVLLYLMVEAVQMVNEFKR